ncbi:Hypothetical Protein FCC1311_037412 [Hondaea fermentalgiana]|uniref:Uncharacterized protein n=1 Tax=Hondaea fermentalgiana TaxID=2315210 RepID=A0A2R5GCU0_9STRA|nr:Hypothetical Protein FCC1311_037412 [Hondaea fermentalgiana]|eukprot:GBG27518.1 Hypothetical Protein FCC1311_037412 [Hondaea fermentalgiana]
MSTFVEAEPLAATSAGKLTLPMTAAEIQEKLGREGEVLLGVLDGTPSLQTFHSGRWELTAQDIETALGEDALRRIEKAVKPRMDSVFGLRQNLINLKKVYLHLQMPGSELQKRINQYTCLFYADGKDWYQHLIAEQEVDSWRKPKEETGAALYQQVSRALQECNGAQMAVLDARQYIKNICCVPRHPNKPTSFELQLLPATLWSAQVFSDLEREWPGIADKDLIEARKAYFQGKRDMARPSECDADRLAKERLDALVDKIVGAVDAHDNKAVRHFVKCSCVARGVSKALRIEVEAERLHESVREMIKRLRGLQDRLLEVTKDSPQAYYKLVRFTCQVDAMIKVLLDLDLWLKRVREEPTRLWFGAADRDASAGLFVPPDFEAVASIHDGLEEILQRWRPQLEARLRDPDNPEYAAYLKGRKACKRCRAQYSKPFVANNGLCYFCELTARDTAAAAAAQLSETALQSGLLMDCTLQLRCVPKGATKAPMPTMCPHSHRCFVCDGWTCELCNAVRLDGDGVAAVVEESDPDVLLFDFDRTFASTRSGADPLVVKNGMSHTLDPHLASLAHGRAPGSVHVVTRNSHKRQIEAFLAERELAHVQVHSLRHFASANDKADMIDSLLTSAQTALFVDDSWQEVLAPRLRDLVFNKLGKVRVVLFDRSQTS